MWKKRDWENVLLIIRSATGVSQDSATGGPPYLLFTVINAGPCRYRKVNFRYYCPKMLHLQERAVHHWSSPGSLLRRGARRVAGRGDGRPIPWTPLLIRHGISSVIALRIQTIPLLTAGIYLTG